MGEIRLTCPECGAEYRIAEGAIPPGGRSVECSSCGTVWHQPGIAPSDDPFGDQSGEVTPKAAPQLNRPLPDSVLSVLREEAELARQQRQTAATPLRPSAASPADAGDAGEDWPATTVTAPLTDAVAAALASALPSDPPAAGPSPSRHINARPSRPAAIPPHQVMEATVTRSTPHRATGPASDARTNTVQPARPPAPDGYRRGVTWAIGIAAALLLLYVAAPRFEDQGRVGATLMEWRLTVDDGRAWLNDRAAGLLGRAQN